MKAVIFDLDETLVDSKNVHRSTLKQALKENGFSTSKFRFTFGATDRQEILDNFPNIKEYILKRILARKRNLVVKNAHKFKPLPHASNVINKLKKQMKVCLFTSNSRRVRIAIVKACKLPKFGIVVDKSNIKRPKPKPDGLLKIIKRLGIKKKEVIYVSDSDIDIKSAKAAGIKIIINKHKHVPKNVKKADFVIKDLRKVLKIVNKVGK